MSGLFRRRPRPAPVPPPRVVEDAAAPVTDADEPAPAPLTSWHDLAEHLITEGAEPLECPPICRRKGLHRHLRHAGASADVIVSPAAVERSGA